jgi:hypothetical protein
MLVHAQVKKMKEIVKVDLPVRFRIGTQGEILASLLARNTLCKTLFIKITCCLEEFIFRNSEWRADVHGKKVPTSLTVCSRLRAPLRRIGALCSVNRYRVPSRVLIHTCGAMADPLPPAVHGDADVKLQLAHLKRGGVRVPQKVSDQCVVFLCTLCACTIRNARRLNDRCVAAHVVNDSHEAIVEDGEALP